MFKHILLPTDGSAASEAAIRQCMQFAREIGARATGLYAIPEFHAFTYQAEIAEDTPQQFRKDSEAHARTCLTAIEQLARNAGVPCELASIISDRPYEAIIATATERGCDLIAMASHGRSGIKGLLMGSQTQRVLAHSTIPVLVYRGIARAPAAER